MILQRSQQVLYPRMTPFLELMLLLIHLACWDSTMWIWNGTKVQKLTVILGRDNTIQ